MSQMQRKALKAELGDSYKDAILARALAETRTRGLSDLIRQRLGRDALAEIQADIIVETESKRQDEETPNG